MWDLETIIRMNNEAFRASQKKDSTPSCKQEEAKRNARLWNIKDRVFGKASYLRSVYEGEVHGCSSQSGTGETLPWGGDLVIYLPILSWQDSQRARMGERERIPDMKYLIPILILLNGCSSNCKRKLCCPQPNHGPCPVCLYPNEPGLPRTK